MLSYKCTSLISEWKKIRATIQLCSKQKSQKKTFQIIFGLRNVHQPIAIVLIQINIILTIANRSKMTQLGSKSSLQDSSTKCVTVQHGQNCQRGNILLLFRSSITPTWIFRHANFVFHPGAL